LVSLLQYLYLDFICPLFEGALGLICIPHGGYRIAFFMLAERQFVAGCSPCRCNNKPVLKHQRTASIWARQDVPGATNCDFS